MLPKDIAMPVRMHESVSEAQLMHKNVLSRGFGFVLKTEYEANWISVQCHAVRLALHGHGQASACCLNPLM